jgi:hypothetical protein
MESSKPERKFDRLKDAQGGEGNRRQNIVNNDSLMF